jgi:hypothetical protein
MQPGRLRQVIDLSLTIAPEKVPANARGFLVDPQVAIPHLPVDICFDHGTLGGKLAKIDQALRRGGQHGRSLRTLPATNASSVASGVTSLVSVSRYRACQAVRNVRMVWTIACSSAVFGVKALGKGGQAVRHTAQARTSSTTTERFTEGSSPGRWCCHTNDGNPLGNSSALFPALWDTTMNALSTC